MNERAKADLAAIRDCTAALLTAVNACDVHRVLEVWADDGVLMPPGHPSVNGRAALLEYFDQLFLRARFVFEFGPTEIDLGPELAVERITYRVTMWPVTSQPPTRDVGKGLHVYRRQTDGTWKLQFDMWNSDRPAAASSARSD
jgi:uncharacterized protein (TIGR02246 family)